MRHALQWQAANGVAPQWACCLYATAPFVRAADLRDGLEQLQRRGGGFVFPVARYPFPIQRAVRLDADGRVGMLHPELFAVRSQDLEPCYHDAGQFYWGSVQAWRSAESIFSADATALVLPAERVQDIDTPEDWRHAELLFDALRSAE